MSEQPKPTSAASTSAVTAESEVARLCAELIRIDSTNYGDGSGPGEREAAEYVMAELTEVGLDPVLLESEPGRATVVVRLEGEDAGRPGLAVHGHLDVVPANAADWQVDPFSGEERDGCIWGRGAVDMKDMDAMILANIREFARTGTKPARDTTFAFFADEEAGGTYGSAWLVDNHPQWFDGVTQAISEVGGYSVTLPTPQGERRAYLLQTAEKGIAWLRLRAHGRAGHGSVPNDDNAIVHLAGAVGRIAAHPWPQEYIASVRQLLDGLSELTAVPWADDDLEDLLATIGGAQGFVRGTLRDTANLTMLESGYKHNVIPQSASASLDCRFLPGHEDQLMQTVRELAGEHVDVEVVHRDVALEAPFESDIVEAMKQSLLREDPGAAVLPYCLSGGTDNKALGRLGIDGYGFAPLRLPADLDFAPMFHGIDERVPVESLEFGARVLGDFLRTC
ncbi:M20/M25/M40 family metallo-hydrolase [Terracoccus luteus]|uniref:Acetylornithine deacetylase/succinyl-diaminopimelate desuccinylase-like protein n=1 Tax=Terracoccus luteus TaxID=53356 RepID=A0A495XU44_9MICO|nr:M20/M25/M40 family metallo-hydrolase [Terracoccus luteus]MBB2987683.1 acetylornithine deacetylase/succinyl-diaminopimelate desuccinylase-like protein [Terracoccus luteus]MCP2173334.1 acetylornithine deacetylase/succinyl-diaminopimelate desuccinylase-like protein [Terracoccus luteus]RKT78071.1 acetylornithine deacetylase/succinyl-diaminopimelate desuccinylase-like protein [Terracoccus luteus]